MIALVDNGGGGDLIQYLVLDLFVLQYIQVKYITGSKQFETEENYK